MGSIRVFSRSLSVLGLAGLVAGGCSLHRGQCGTSGAACGDQQGCQTQACCKAKPCGHCNQCCGNGCCSICGKFGGCLHRSSNAVPDALPLGSSVRAFDQVMQTNAEAADFIMYRLDFVGQTAELTSDGKDHVLEIAARMKSAPFPVIVEREPNNSDPELDALRRNLIAQILTDLGNMDAQQRTVVGTPYGPGFWSWPGQIMYYQYIGAGGNFGNFGGGGGFGGGFGGGGFGGGAGGGFY